MSEENVEAVLAGFAAYSRGDLEEVLKDWAPDAIVDWTNSLGFDQAVYQGYDQIRAFWERLLQAFEEVRVEIVDLQEVEEGVFVAENVAHLRGRDGIQVQARSAFLIRRRDGLTRSFTLYQTREEALEAAALSE
jgi:ketosteroid isomerase-like protein